LNRLGSFIARNRRTIAIMGIVQFVLLAVIGAAA